MAELRDRELENEHLVLNGEEVEYLGPNLTLRRCKLTLRLNARALIVDGAQFIGCTIEARKTLENFAWDGAVLKDCQFSGNFSGCDFGQPEADAQGRIEACDFTAARLDGCRFMGCDVETLRFPAWPCFTVLEPFKRSEELNRIQWPGTLGIVVKTFSLCLPSTRAMTFSATALAKEYDTTEKDIRAVLEKLDGVIF